MEETKRKAKPSEVGGILRRMMGPKEEEERMKRKKFRHERSKFGNEHELLSFGEAI